MLPPATPPIYVEILIHAPLDELWRRTQTPELHARWDLRFTEIHYEPRPDPAKPQRFLYATRIGFGLAIRGRGETRGERSAGPDGERASALRFWSDDAKSLIREGSGFWRYVPEEGEGVRFLTRYDYDVRFGAAGRGFDRWIFRPLMGWATAWSFDRLRLWLERDLDPGIALRLSVIHAVARLAVAGAWIYHGLVPKLLFHHADELRMLADAGVPAGAIPSVVVLFGALEIAFGGLHLVRWGARWPFLGTLLAMLAASVGVAVNSPAYLVAAFNPVTLNGLLAAAAFVGWLAAGAGLPSAKRCRRRPISGRNEREESDR